MQSYQRQKKARRIRRQIKMKRREAIVDRMNWGWEAEKEVVKVREIYVI